MSIKLDDKSYIVGLWFSHNPTTKDDWLSCVIRDPENPKRYKGWWRFRYQKDDKIFDSVDEKKWAEFYSKEDINDEEIICITEKVQKILQFQFSEIDKIIVQGNLEKFMELSKEKNWMNLKTE
jgi:hypothetical protein